MLSRRIFASIDYCLDGPAGTSYVHMYVGARLNGISTLCMYVEICVRKRTYIHMYMHMDIRHIFIFTYVFVLSAMAVDLDVPTHV